MYKCEILVRFYIRRGEVLTSHIVKLKHPRVLHASLIVNIPHHYSTLVEIMTQVITPNFPNKLRTLLNVVADAIASSKTAALLVMI